MPRIFVENEGDFEVEAGTRLVLALEDNGYDIMHRCGGMARCTTCRVHILAGDAPPQDSIEMTALEKDEDLIGVYRLSCQIRIESDLTVRIGMRASAEGVRPGPRPRP